MQSSQLSYTADPSSAALPSSSGWQAWQERVRRSLDTSNENHLLNLFTALLLASALIIMMVVGLAVHAIYSAAMVKNAETAAMGVVRAIMSSEADHLLQTGPDGNTVLAIRAADRNRLDLQMHRYLAAFNMHRVKLFLPDRQIIYSTDAGIIGKFDKDNTFLAQVIDSGQVLSNAGWKKNFVDLGGHRLAEAQIVEVYSPIFDARQRLLGVFEVYVDITQTRAEIVKVLMLTMTALGAVLSLCLFSLYLPMRRGTQRLVAAHRALQELAIRDFLTGAYNRRYFEEQVRQEFYRMRRQNSEGLLKESIGFIMADIDNFKTVNDSHGHAVGDEVLREVVRRLSDGLREYDVLCRYGGEEFVIMLPHTQPHEAMQVAERLQQCVVDNPVLVKGMRKALSVTVSFGVATSCDATETEDAVIGRADQALYRAKDGGRNRVVLADQPASGAT